MVSRALPRCVLAGGVAFATLHAASAATAAPHELTRDIDLSAAAWLAFAYDDNPLLGRRGQFLNAAITKGSRQVDLAALQAVDAQVGWRVASADRASVRGRYELAELRTTEELQGYDAMVVAAYDKSLSPGARVTPSVRGIYHQEQPDWSFRAVEPRVSATYVYDSGLMAELRYTYTREQFGVSPDHPLKNSYANIDFCGHDVELDHRQWFGRRVRGRLLQDLWTGGYAGNLSANLADYAGLRQGERRRDAGAGATAEIGFAPARAVFFTVGGRYEVNASNSDAFRYHAAHALASVLVVVRRDHTVFAQIDAGRYAYPDERFDRRFVDTRRDQRWDASLVYRFDAAERLRFELSALHIEGASNDCIYFSPERDAVGLPVYSRSYSCYARTRVEASARWEF